MIIIWVYLILVWIRRVARIWKRGGGGGAFLKEWDNCKRSWPEFSLFLNQNHTVYPKLRRIFRPKSKIQTVFQAESQQLLHNFGTQIPLKGLFSFFQQKSASKAPKTCDFAYFTGQRGGLQPPPPPPPGYATRLSYMMDWFEWIQIRPQGNSDRLFKLDPTSSPAF